MQCTPHERGALPRLRDRRRHRLPGTRRIRSPGSARRLRRRVRGSRAPSVRVRSPAPREAPAGLDDQADSDHVTAARHPTGEGRPVGHHPVPCRARCAGARRQRPDVRHAPSRSAVPAPRTADDEPERLGPLSRAGIASPDGLVIALFCAGRCDPSTTFTTRDPSILEFLGGTPTTSRPTSPRRRAVSEALEQEPLNRGHPRHGARLRPPRRAPLLSAIAQISSRFGC